MARDEGAGRRHDRWAHLRFAVVGALLAAPPKKGELQTALTALAAREWQHPIRGEPVRFAFSTLERWYYHARHAATDPVGRLPSYSTVRRYMHAQGLLRQRRRTARDRPHADHPASRQPREVRSYEVE